MGLVTPELGTFIWMLISFLGLFFLLKKYAWSSIVTAIDERNDSIKEALLSAESAKEEMSKLQADNQKILKEARRERESMLKEAKELGEQIVREAKTKATEEADKVVASARQAIESDKTAALGEIKSQVALLSVEIAEKVLRRQFAEDQQQKDYFQELMKEVNIN
ncbi:F0F1 ATP synthase subunit B [Ancylomarina sp. 16SWW S1-10-2]|uniref:F0F1 ATP synthase subunit B n=1 Tax=Ancylomarina sp. 16SWW S1-10-2 TaxID=2499681 RepID=UPI0012AEACDB|nr:F0F1 ATP synthase subunit B [Ancylomarina sp. 16SWW S1-10-2]MRT92157.1 ATP synthase F0 subunit B [Ancylomarina sp. 16SWW S1-10-2]